MSTALRVSVPSLRRYVAANVPEETRRSQVVVWNPRPAEAGEQAQIDYGQLGRWLDPVTGRLRTVWAFVMVLACSRHMFVRPVLKMDQRAWTECHVAAFAFFGGSPARLVPDNLKTGVDKPDLYDPKLNRSYAELAAHYGCLIDPARAVKPRDKASGGAADAVCAGLLLAGPGVHQPGADAGRGGALVRGGGRAAARAGRWTAPAPAVVFDAVEKEALKPLPAEPFVLATWSRAKIGPDIHVKVGRVLYSVPWRLIGKTVDVRADRDDGAVLHRRASWSRPTRARSAASRPTSPTTRRRRSPSTCAPRPGAASKAAGIGPACEQVIAELLAENALYRLRAAQGVIGLADRHDPSRLEAACATAITVGDPSYRTIKGILAAGTEAGQPRPSAAGRGAAAFLRGPASFANVIALPGTITSDAVTAAEMTP